MHHLEEKRLFLQELDELLSYCLHHHVSDLHFEPQGFLKLRQQGRLEPYQNIAHESLKKITQRFKILAKLNIHQIKQPQDGQFIWTSPYISHPIPCRISTCPTLNGEKLVVRLLLRNHLTLNWHTIGLNFTQQALIEHYTKPNHPGLVLVNGPTGSGKTTTLYSLLEHINTHHLNIISIEDPIEIPYLNFCQIELQKDLGFSLTHCLRTVLRQDPDVIMLGEIRDRESAQLCLEAAQTGHLVLSSLHSSNAKEAILRLHHLGIHHHQLAHFLKLMITQHFTDSSSKPAFELFEITPRIKQNLLNTQEVTGLTL
jgi:type II secretory ATPase GspE/PulE/Tfp pilus assembly ATPase PilB-like protein